MVCDMMGSVLLCALFRSAMRRVSHRVSGRGDTENNFLLIVHWLIVWVLLRGCSPTASAVRETSQMNVLTF